MSERTTIGGTIYEAIGSSSSNLLLKCNGTARIQWGGKLIDLIKNGKIASENSQELIFIVTDESEIKSDGIYLLTNQEYNQLWISKDGIKYDLTNSDLYISTNKSQTLTVDQKKQAQANIGLIYNSLEELQSAKVQNGIAYVLNTKTLYTIKDGIIEEFEAKLKNITVDNKSADGDVISGEVKLILSILDDEYLILADKRITANYSIHVKDSAQLGSENADATQGYRLYMDRGTSYLDVDEINVRHGINIPKYTEITFEKFIASIERALLIPHEWYLIIDFQNHWKLDKANNNFRPILVRALTENTLYEKSYLFKDHRVVISYDYSYQEEIIQTYEEEGILKERIVKTKGLITWMKDSNNNEANFDFLDYTDSDGNELTTLHYQNDNQLRLFQNIQENKISDEIETLDKSIFPKNSHNNKLIVYDLKGIVLKDKKLNKVSIDDVIIPKNVTIVDFQFDDSKENTYMFMYNNTIECRGIILTKNCVEFYNNNIKCVINAEINNTFINNIIDFMYFHNEYINIEYDYTLFCTLDDNSVFNKIYLNGIIKNSQFINVRHCLFNNITIENTIFNNIENSVFEQDINDSIIKSVKRPYSQYKYFFKRIDNSHLSNISENVIFPALIKNSILNSISANVHLESNIQGCTIDNIYFEVKVQGIISNSVIKNISDSTIIGNIHNSTINNISNKVQYEGTIENSIIDSIDGVKFEGRINNSTIATINEYASIIGTIENCTINKITNGAIIEGNLINSTITDIVNSYIYGKIENCTITSISDLSEINKEGILSNCIIDIITNNSIINGVLSNSNITKIENSQIAGTITNCTINNIDSESQISKQGTISNSSIFNINNSTIENAIESSTFEDLIETFIKSSIDKGIFKNIQSSTINEPMYKVKFNNIDTCIFNASFNDVKFLKLNTCNFAQGNIERTISFYDISSEEFSKDSHGLLYTDDKRKEIYIHNQKVQITCIPDVIFYRGMIIMHSGIEDIPDGWAPCDGKEYEWNGIKSKTPDLTNRFIKAVTSSEDVKATDNKSLNENGEITLTTDNLPAHSHPHKSHKHTFSDSGTAQDTIGALTSSEEGTVITAVEGGTEGKAIIKTTYNSRIEVYDSSVAISGNTSSVTSEEDGWLYKKEPDPINTTPNYYSLIFIMKL